MLQEMQVQDRAYALAGDMFEIGAKIQVFKRGVLFLIGANKLYDLWRMYNTFDKIYKNICKEIQDRYFHRSFDEVYSETKIVYLRELSNIIEKAKKDLRIKMVLVFCWYFIYGLCILRLQVKVE